MKRLLLAILIIALPFVLEARGGCGGGGHSSCSSHSSFSSSHSSSSEAHAFPVSHSMENHSVSNTRTISRSFSYKPSATSRNASATKNATVTLNNTGVSVEPISQMSSRRISYYRSNPSYAIHNGYYVPMFYYNPNQLFWYYIIFNNVTHHREMIRARSKAELQRRFNQNCIR